MKNEGLKIGLAGMLGCLAGTTLVWHYTHEWWAIIVAFPTSFLVGWIACAPGPFFAAFPRAWQEIRGWRLAPGVWTRFQFGLVSLLVCAQLATPFLLLFLWGYKSAGKIDLTHDDRMVGGILGFSIFLGFGLLLGAVKTVEALFGKTREKDRDRAEVRNYWSALCRYNLLTLPFLVVYWVCKGLMLAFGWFVVEVAPRIPGAIKALALFVPRLISAWANLTASNGRLTSSCAGVLGLFICLWQNWPPVPGCLTGFVAGIVLWGSAKLALRYLPQPQTVTA